MGKASSTKKVSRAASTGGGRTAGRSKPWLWYLTMGLVTVLGVAGIVISRQQRLDDIASGSGAVAPIVGKDHWHAAYGVYLCDKFAPTIEDQSGPLGIHTHADGVIHIHPSSRAAAGDNATLKVYADAVGMTLDDSEIKLPGGTSHREGKTKCGDQPGIVQVKVNDTVVTDNVADIKLTDRALITIAFAPRGAELPPPPSAPNLDNLSDVDPTTTTVAPGQEGAPVDGIEPGEGDAPSTDTTVPPGDAPSTTVAGASPSTAP